MTDLNEIKIKLKSNGLKVTPQRIIILEAIYELNNHPTAENIIEYIGSKQLNIATGTVYKVLETLIKKGLIKMVSTEKGSMRYDGMVKHHHHLYCKDKEIFKDYMDDELDSILRKYFAGKDLPGFEIEDFVLCIKGKFT